MMLFVNLADMTALEETETQLGEIRSAATHGVNIVQHSVKVPWPAEGETPDYSVSDKWVDAALSASLNALL